MPPSTPSKIYASVHRGSGHKSRLCTVAYEQGRQTVGAFLGADPELDTVVFTKNTMVPAPTIAVGKEVGIRHPSLRAQRVIN